MAGKFNPLGWFRKNAASDPRNPMHQYRQRQEEFYRLNADGVNRINANIGAIGGLQNVPLGIGTGGDKSQYDTRVTPGLQDQQYYGNYYRTSPIAKRLVNLITDDMVSKWLEFEHKDNDTREEFEKFLKKIRVKKLIRKAVKMMLIHGGCAVLVDSDDARLDEPIDLHNLKGGRIKLTVIERANLQPGGQINFSPLGDNYNKPEHWHLVLTDQMVHESRLMFFIYDELPFYEKINNIWWGDSILLPLINDIDNTDRARYSLQNLIQKSSLLVMKQNIKDSAINSRQADNNAAAVERSFLNQNKNVINIDNEDDLIQLEVKNLKTCAEIMKFFKMVIAGTCGVPLSRFLGSSVGGFSSGDNEITQWYEQVNSMQEAYLEDPLEQLFMILQFFVFGEDKEIGFGFSALNKLTDTEKTDIDNKKADTYTKYINLLGKSIQPDIIEQISTDNVLSSVDHKRADELKTQVKNDKDFELPSQDNSEGKVGNNSETKGKEDK